MKSKLLLMFILVVHPGVPHYLHDDIPWQEYHEMDCCPHPPPPPLPLPPDISQTWVRGYMMMGRAKPSLRVGTGDYTMHHDGAELCCYFPPNVVLLSNVVWEKLKKGHEGRHHGWLEAGQKYSLDNIPGGSTLRLYDVTYLDRGIYRCLATGLDTETGMAVTVFQDVYFYPVR